MRSLLSSFQSRAWDVHHVFVVWLISFLLNRHLLDSRHLAGFMQFFVVTSEYLKVAMGSFFRIFVEENLSTRGTEQKIATREPYRTCASLHKTRPNCNMPWEASTRSRIDSSKMVSFQVFWRFLFGDESDVRFFLENSDSTCQLGLICNCFMQKETVPKIFTHMVVWWWFTVVYKAKNHLKQSQSTSCKKTSKKSIHSIFGPNLYAEKVSFKFHISTVEVCFHKIIEHPSKFITLKIQILLLMMFWRFVIRQKKVGKT